MAKQHMQRLRAAESQEEHDARIVKIRQHISVIQETESVEQREIRLSALRMHNSQVRADETPEQREVRLSALRMHSSQVRKAEKSQIEAFNKTINIFCDKVCEICTKRSNPNQVTNHKIKLSTASYLPAELTSKGTILLCLQAANAVLWFWRTLQEQQY
ncbi:hypothetical protein TNCT_347131 [Trichonephila clavata]|uniref:STPR domain-containing protein n=1 Tax=Trichonephila clavata TaxID=2740835 RepID=A0A8X6FRQ4_TRICU|nr:hypothetical protein TNCT_347131 [Trichonephila clavata]